MDSSIRDIWVVRLVAYKMVGARLIELTGYNLQNSRCNELRPYNEH